jgi:GNAT superfamily N-acetyltransferase
VIFGRKITKHHRGKLQTEIEDMSLPNPVIRSHYGNGFIKQYVRDHLILRTEAASNNVNDYGVKKAVENLPVLQKALSAINDNYLSVQQDILETFVDRGQLRKLAEPSITATGKRIPVLVRSDLKGHGIGWQLMDLIIRYARSEKLKCIEGQVLQENTTMLDMCRQLGFQIADEPNDRAIKVVRLELQ